jgi:hypothetical protein
MLVEQKSAGRDLKPAKQQALDYFPGLKDYGRRKNPKPEALFLLDRFPSLFPETTDGTHYPSRVGLGRYVG